MVPVSVDRIAPDVLEGVVHPAHVPLEPEAEPPVVGGTGDPGPGGRLLGDRDRVGMVDIDPPVELLEEADRAEVLVAAEFVRDPLALGPRIVAVQHRGHGVDPQPVDVVAVEPEVRAAEQETPDLVAVVVEDRTLPVGMEPQALGRRARRGGCRRRPPARARPSGSATAPSRGSRRCRVGAAGRPGTSGPGACRSERSARSSRSSGSPTSRRTGAPSPGAARRG